MTPVATGLNIVFCSYSSTIEESRGQCSNLVQQLCSGNISRLRVESRTDYDLSSLDLYSLSGLASIAQGFTTACAPFAHVASSRMLKLCNNSAAYWKPLRYSLKGAVAAKYLLRAHAFAASAAVPRELRLYERPLCASKALSIISAIPSLAALTSTINELVSDIKAIPPDEHPNALHVKYPHANISFRRLNALSDDSDDEDENGWSDDYDLDNMIYCIDCGLMRDECGCDNYFDIIRSSNGGKNVKDKPDLAKKVAAVAVQIAVLCPNFRHVVLPREVRGEFSREVTLANANGPFVTYANRLSRLIYQDKLLQ